MCRRVEEGTRPKSAIAPRTSRENRQKSGWRQSLKVMVDIDNKEIKVDYLFKFIIIGDTGVGKSCILNQYLRGKCKFRFIPVTQFLMAILFDPTNATMPFSLQSIRARSTPWASSSE